MSLARLRGIPRARTESSNYGGDFLHHRRRRAPLAAASSGGPRGWRRRRRRRWRRHQHSFNLSCYTCCSGRGRTAARGMIRRAHRPLWLDTWRWCSGHGSTAARGVSELVCPVPPGDSGVGAGAAVSSRTLRSELQVTIWASRPQDDNIDVDADTKMTVSIWKMRVSRR